MGKADEPEQKLKKEAHIVPNIGFGRVLDRELQKQLDDLNGMKSLNPNTRSRKKQR